MKKLLMGSMLLMVVAAFASNKESKNVYAFEQRYNVKDTVPKDTSDTTHKPDLLLLEKLLSKN